MSVDPRRSSPSLSPFAKTLFVAGVLMAARDAGETWTPITDDAPMLATGAVAFAPSNPDTIYAATGEYAGVRFTHVGVGILKSTNGGQNCHGAGGRSLKLRSPICGDWRARNPHLRLVAQWRVSIDQRRHGVSAHRVTLGLVSRTHRAGDCPVRSRRGLRQHPEWWKNERVNTSRFGRRQTAGQQGGSRQTDSDHRDGWRNRAVRRHRACRVLESLAVALECELQKGGPDGDTIVEGQRSILRNLQLRLRVPVPPCRTHRASEQGILHLRDGVLG